MCPTHARHRKEATKYGLNFKQAQEVDVFLDFPKVGNYPLPHKFLHNPIGVYLVKKKFGDKAAQYALDHIRLDFEEEFIKQMTKKLLKSTKRR
ncbi:MAG: hypothetical protein K6T73_03360 [Candidatus Bathyarchaeota archaeon]|nr:hypothetical protein [Candidatus Bathyarchaeota archaeon]